MKLFVFFSSHWSVRKSVGYAELAVTDADCCDHDACEEVPPTYSEDEICEALANQTLTFDQGWYLHTQGRSWRIQVR